MRILIGFLCISMLVCGCTTTGTRTPMPDGSEKVSCTSGPGGGDIRWEDGTICRNGSIVDNFSIGVRAIQSEASRDVRLIR